MFLDQDLSEMKMQAHIYYASTLGRDLIVILLRPGLGRNFVGARLDRKSVSDPDSIVRPCQAKIESEIPFGQGSVGNRTSLGG